MVGSKHREHGHFLAKKRTTCPMTNGQQLSYLKGVRNCLEAAKEAAEDGINAEIIRGGQHHF